MGKKTSSKPFVVSISRFLFIVSYIFFFFFPLKYICYILFVYEYESKHV
ncbi:hypothetical protein ACMBCN_03565 [Candidatus Liberibacter asiaticus]|nr:hypothetical protein [Candidatus Liberibacter asiaticus]